MPLDVGRQLGDKPLTPNSRFEFARDVFADAPVEVYQFGVDRVVGALAGAFDEIEYFAESPFLGNRGNSLASGETISWAEYTLWKGGSFLLPGGFAFHGALMTSQVMSSKSVASRACSCWFGMTKSRPVCSPAATRLWKVRAMDSTAASSSLL